jgi:CII-binding regulator of phage lambda lysogenization HflD
VGKIEEIDKLTRALADADIKLKSIIANIEKIDKEISVLGPRKNELQQNLEFLKSSGTIPIAHEYKNAKLELSKTIARLILISSDLKKSNQACSDVERIIDKFKRDLAKLSKIDDNNVLRPIFGAKHGKE